MPATQYESRRLYYLHVFKDIPGSNWTNPTVHVFPLSSKSASKFNTQTGRYARHGQKGHPGNRDGVVNLYRLPSDQLSFLQSYVGKLNAEVEENKVRMLNEWKDGIEKEETNRVEREVKRSEERRKLVEAKRQLLREKAAATLLTAGSRQDENDLLELKAKSTGARRGPIRYDNNRYDSDSSDETARVRGRNYMPREQFFTPGALPPPPPPLQHLRPHRRPPVGQINPGPSPVIFETQWAIEDVELMFIPETVTLVPQGESYGPGNLRTWVPPHLYNPTNPNNKPETTETRQPVKLEISTNKISSESHTSFAVILSRCTGVEIPTSTYSNPYFREHSPARSYYSDYSVDDEEGEVAEEVVTKEVQNVGWFAPPPPPGFFPPPPPPPPPFPIIPLGSPQTQTQTQKKNCNDDGEWGTCHVADRDEDGDTDGCGESVETESRAAEEGESCCGEEGVVFIKDRGSKSE